MIYQLIYISSVAEALNTDAFVDIARQSRKNNEALGITGMMLVHNGSILQILEGEEFVVESLYKKISFDTRHTQCSVMVRRHCQNREFERWHMGYKYVENDTNEAAIFKLTYQALKSAIPHEASPEAQAMGRSFARASGL